MIYNSIIIFFALIWGTYLLWDLKYKRGTTAFIASIQNGNRCYCCNKEEEFDPSKPWKIEPVNKMKQRMKLCKVCRRDNVISLISNKTVGFMNYTDLPIGKWKSLFLMLLLDIRVDMVYMLLLVFSILTTIFAMFIDNEIYNILQTIIHRTVMITFWLRYLIRGVYAIKITPTKTVEVT